MPTGTVRVQKIVKSEAEWRRQLSANAFDITRRADTEMAYTGSFWNLHRRGIFRCICCDTALFSSETKFDSGTGWPSFWQPIAKQNVAEAEDNSWGVRTAVACAGATRTWVMSSTMGRHRPVCATASTRHPCVLLGCDRCGCRRVRNNPTQAKRRLEGAAQKFLTGRGCRKSIATTLNYLQVHLLELKTRDGANQEHDPCPERRHIGNIRPPALDGLQYADCYLIG